ELRLDGGFNVKGSFTEIGQGVVQAIAQLAAEALNTSIDKIEVVFADTAETPDTSVTSASRQLFLAGNALREAASLMVEAMKKGLELYYGRPFEISLRNGAVRTSTGQEIPLSRVAEVLEKTGVGRSVIGVYEVPRVEPIPGSLEIPHLFYMFGATLVLVELNTLTGAVSVKKLVTAADVGRVVNPQTLTGQMEGAAAQGVGFALLEDVKIREGRLLTTNFSTYLIPSIKDVPDIEAVPVEDHEDSGPFGAKGIGEIGIISVAPAIANAIHDAAGVRPLEAPMTPERVYWLVKQRR
ncbi:MAG: molybdopterin cofactor-binding domain-containing protein, partial [Candidatus Caldarchaeum sp.]